MLDDYECSLCDNTVVTDITLDLAYIEMSGQIFANAIELGNYEHAQAVVSSLLFSAQMLSKYATHKAHQK
jgi:hypothetical protein